MGTNHSVNCTVRPGNFCKLASHLDSSKMLWVPVCTNHSVDCTVRPDNFCKLASHLEGSRMLWVPLHVGLASYVCGCLNDSKYTRIHIQLQSCTMHYQKHLDVCNSRMKLFPFSSLLVLVMIFLGVSDSCAPSGGACGLKADGGEVQAGEVELCCPGLYCLAPVPSSPLHVGVCSPWQCKGEGVACNPSILGSICCPGLQCVLPPHPQLGTPGKCGLEP